MFFGIFCAFFKVAESASVSRLLLFVASLWEELVDHAGVHEIQ